MEDSFNSMGLTAVRPGLAYNYHKSKRQRRREWILSYIKNVQDTVGEKNQPKKKITKTKKRRSSRKKKLNAYDLSALSEFLPDLETLTTTKSDVTKEERINCKSRQALVQNESARILSAIQNPPFLKDPFEAIHKQLLEKKKTGEKGKSSAEAMEI